MAKREDLPKTYSPSDSEAAILDLWEQNSAFGVNPAKISGSGETYSVLIPPPNVTAALHLGHAFNSSLQDAMIRYHRMKGAAALWMPGTDHAGIATQTVVEKRLLREGTKRADLGREAFVAKTQEWKDEYESIIIEQFKAMGASCDWDRTRFTMDEMCSVAVRHAFYVLFKDQLIYRGKRLVNWDPATQTALADDEVEMEDIAGHMWYLKYPLTDGSGSVTVATTRPETMLGDTAVALNPNDPRAAELRGKSVCLPIVGRNIPIVEDEYVVLPDPESSDAKAQFASGFLKVTPAHDQNDYELGQRHDLPVINIMGPDASISDQYGWEDISAEAQQFVGMSREDARAAIVAWFKDNNLLEEVKEYSHAVGHSYRSHVPIEPWLSDQWYVAVTDDKMSGAAMRAQNLDQLPHLDSGGSDQQAEVSPGDGEISFYPERYAKTFRSWHESIRDWCISRQLWWGHQIPIWLKTTEGKAPASLSESESLAVGSTTVISGEWSAMGAVHTVRRITEFDFEEAICVPPQSTLHRLEGVAEEVNEASLVAALEAAGFVRDPDVLDTWFSSGLWPLSTMGWPWPQDYPETVGLLEAFKPTSVLMTAREIITLWVSRMTMFNRYFQQGEVPFSDVYIHSMIQDGHGQKMSKSLGNGVDPRDIIHSHGADAMRYTLIHMATETQDARMSVDLVCPYSNETFEPKYVTTSAGYVVAAPEQVSPSDSSKKMVTQYGVATGVVSATEEMPLARNTSSKFDAGRNFTNKVWNATRFVLSRLEGVVESEANREVNIQAASFIDQWIVARLDETVVALEMAYASYKFSSVAEILYDFIWRDLCGRYLESVKPTVDEDKDQQVVLAVMFDAVLRVLHPVCPFVTETLWPHVSAVQSGSIKGIDLPGSDLLVHARWPRIDESIVESDASARFDRLEAFAVEVRALRTQHSIKPKKKVTVYAEPKVLDFLNTGGGVVETLAGIEQCIALTSERPALTSSFVFEGAEVLVSGLVESVDKEAERKRLKKLLDQKSSQIENLEKRLANKNYVEKAKPALVQETRDTLVEVKKDFAATQASFDLLG